MVISICDLFELSRVMQSIMEQQCSYKIQTAFKIHSLLKWIDETEEFVFKRLKVVFGDVAIDASNPLHQAFLLSQIPLIETTLTTEDLLDTDGDVKIDVNDVALLEKILGKTES